MSIRHAAPTGTDGAAPRYVIGEPGQAALDVVSGPAGQDSRWPDVAADASCAAGFEIRAASVRGLVHRRLGTPRQDSYDIQVDDVPRIAVAVCDGIGSLPMSHLAAGIVARAVVASSDALLVDAEELQRAASAVAVRASQELVVTLAPTFGEDLHSIMGTTCVAAILTPRSAGGADVALLSVGDSVAAVLGESGWRLVTARAKTDAAGYQTSTTAALPAAEPRVACAVIELRPGEALFLMSDGVGDPLGSGQGQVGAELARWWADPPRIEEFVGQVGFARRGFDDDRTVVGIWSPPDADA